MSKAPEHMSQQELETYLWGAADLLRGLIDAGDLQARPSRWTDFIQVKRVRASCGIESAF